MGWELPDNLESAEAIDVVLPTGAMGNLTAGIMAKLMGLPIRKCICAVNANDITHRVIQDANFRKQQGAMVSTLSEAINIQVPYNFERILYYVTHRDTMAVQAFYEVPARLRILYASAHLRLRTWCDSARITDEELCRVLKKTHTEYQYLADPHTAVALAAADQKSSGDLAEPERTTVVLATAAPCKFEHAVTTAVGDEVWQSYYAEGLDPPAAQGVMERTEAEPIFFPVKEGSASLEETQRHWEELLKNLLAEIET